VSYDEFLIDKSRFIFYKSVVDECTKRQPIHLLENSEHRGSSGRKGAYHLDHIISIRYGFDNGIPPEIIGDIKNLRFIPWKQNLKKSSKHVSESIDMEQYFIENGSIR